MKINIFSQRTIINTVFIFLFSGHMGWFAKEVCSQSFATGSAPGYKLADTTVSLTYKDTITVSSFTNFELHVKMMPASEISAISLGFYFPDEFLAIDSIMLAEDRAGFLYSIDDSLFRVVWSDVNPINITENDTIITLYMRSLDISSLSNTIKMNIYEFSEFADKSANVIEGVILEIPEIALFKPDPGDTIAGNYVNIYPNPFKDFTTVYLTLESESRVSISLFNAAGLALDMFESKIYPEGEHELRIDGIDLAKGIYFMEVSISDSLKSGSRLFKIMSIR
jgi:hypothetical protein